MTDYPVGYQNLNPNPTVNYQLNRWLPQLDVRMLADAGSQIGTVADCKPVFLRLAELADRDASAGEAAALYRAAEFFMHPDDPDKADTYTAYRSRVYAATEHLGYQRSSVPFGGGELPVLRFAADPGGVLAGAAPLIIHGGFDSYMEELLDWGPEFAALGLEVVLFEGPGQGAALRVHGLTMTADWHEPVAAVMDHLELPACTLFGLSLGGCLALRAAAAEPRVRRIVLVNVLPDFLRCFTDRAPTGVAHTIRTALAEGDPGTINRLAAELAAEPATGWAIEHGRSVCGAPDAFGFFEWLARMNTLDVSESITQPLLATAGSDDHIVPLPHFFRQLSLLQHSPFTARLFTGAEHAGAHCQVGNLRLLLDVVAGWLTTEHLRAGPLRPD